MGRPLICRAPLITLATVIVPARAVAQTPTEPAKPPLTVAADVPVAGRPVPPPPPPSDEVAGTGFMPRFVLETARVPLPEPDPNLLRIMLHGEYEIRLSALSDLPLQPFRNDPSTSTLGQTYRLEHWLRLTPRVTYRETLELVGQIDVPRGFVLGQTTKFVDSAEEPYDDRRPFRADPRWLYLEYRSPIGLFRIGQQGSHWGMGILANDGDHPTLFGDYRGGARVERILFETKPAGKNAPFSVALAGDLVFKDATADLRNGDVALQGVLAAFYADKKQNMLGFYGVYRHQRREAEALAGSTFAETLSVFALDSSGRFNTKLPGGNGHVFGEYEVAYLLGDTNVFRNNERELIRAFGAATRLGAVKTSGNGDERWGSVVGTLEWGWASGDSNPFGGTTRRFRFDPNYNVGLILFDEVLNWKTARAANIARDPALVQRPNPGVDQLPSNGGIFGATYLNPTVVFRPVRPLDLKAGLLLAETTVDFVDPVAVAVSGRFQNYDGGDPTRHDLGLELDLGTEYRVALDYGLGLELGAQGGVLFPGRALADATGTSIGTQYLAVGRVGLQF